MLTWDNPFKILWFFSAIFVLSAANPIMAANPTAPSNLRASAQSSSSIELTWKDNSTGENGFKMERSKKSNFSSSKTINISKNKISYIDTDLTASTKYYYRIRAYVGSAYSKYSNTTNKTTPAPPNQKPTATEQSVTTNEDTTKAITLSGN
ncbi:MAG: fibronectin type III domain-containing protein, partial [Candidatus Poribacteria bacterium]